ncbi:MAG: PAS domain-containing sensor histidine kinase [Bernardetiaceae bacterium]
MGIKNFRLQVTARVLALSLTVFLLSWLLGQGDRYVYTSVGVGALLVWQVSSLIRRVEYTNREVAKLLDSIQNDDFSNLYRPQSEGQSFSELQRALSQVVDAFRQARAEKELQYHYLRTVVQHLGIGILSFDRAGEVQLVNHVAKRLLQVRHLRHLHELNPSHKNLAQVLQSLKTGQKNLVHIQTDYDQIELSLYAIELTFQGKEYVLVTLQNIHNELEEKELTAWQDLVRVLTHEIMNALTPIASLAQSLSTLPPEEIADFRQAAQTIERRSYSLMAFIQEFRQLTQPLLPQYDKVLLPDLIQSTLDAVREEIERDGIQIEVDIPEEHLLLTIDLNLIQQVLEHLLRNAAQALLRTDQPQKLIRVFAGQDQKKRFTITIQDNGPGIAAEALPRLFIPFYTTRPEGSGLGLSVARRIMRHHQGQLSVHSELGKGATFVLRF